MPTIDERLRHVAVKITRAKEHIADLRREIKAFIDTSPYKVACKIDSDRRPVYYVQSVEPTPDSLPAIAGDAVQNLMSALDHLAYQLVCSDTGDKPPDPRRIYFPIQDDATNYEAKKHAKLQGATQATIDAIDALKPYKGGNDDLWILYRLNNIDKHRLLLTVGSCAGGVHLGRIGARLFEKSLAAKPERAAQVAAMFESMNIYVVPSDKGFPLRRGFELFIGYPDEEPDTRQKFIFDVAIDEPGIVESSSLLEMIHKLMLAVEATVTALAPLLKSNP